MNKYMKFAGIATALTATLLLGGCNEEKKYNALKMEVVAESEEYWNTFHNRNDIPVLLKDDPAKAVAYYEQLLKKSNEMKKPMLEKLEKMKEYSKDNVNLSNDYLQVKNDVEKKIGIQEASMKEMKDIHGKYVKK